MALITDIFSIWGPHTHTHTHVSMYMHSHEIQTVTFIVTITLGDSVTNILYPPKIIIWLSSVYFTKTWITFKSYFIYTFNFETGYYADQVGLVCASQLKLAPNSGPSCLCLPGIWSTGVLHHTDLFSSLVLWLFAWYIASSHRKNSNWLMTTTTMVLNKYKGKHTSKDTVNVPLTTGQMGRGFL